MKRDRFLGERAGSDLGERAGILGEVYVGETAELSRNGVGGGPPVRAQAPEGI